jgi:hypothetical protein
MSPITLTKIMKTTTMNSTLVNYTMNLTLKDLCLDFDPFGDDDEKYVIRYRNGSAIFKDGLITTPRVCLDCGVPNLVPDAWCSLCTCNNAWECRLCGEPTGPGQEGGDPLCYGCYRTVYENWTEPEYEFC